MLECIYWQQSCCRQLCWSRGLVIMRLVMYLVCTIWLLPKPRWGPNSMVHLKGDMVMAEKGQLLRLRITSCHPDTNKRFSAATQLRSVLQNAFRVCVWTKTICSRLHESGLQSRRPCIWILLFWDYCLLQYDWSMDNVGWGRIDWRLTFFHWQV